LQTKQGSTLIDENVVHPWISLFVCGRSFLIPLLETFFLMDRVDRTIASSFSGPITSLSLIELLLCYTLFVLWLKGVQAPQAKTLRGLQSLARDCDFAYPHRKSSPEIRKSRWLLWLEDSSSDESRRAAAALRYPTAMLTN